MLMRFKKKIKLLKVFLSVILVKYVHRETFPFHCCRCGVQLCDGSTLYSSVCSPLNEPLHLSALKLGNCALMFPVAAAAHLVGTTEGRKAWLWLTVQGTQSIAVGRQGWWGSRSCSMLSAWKERAQIRKWGHSSRPQVLPSPTVAHFPPEAYLRKFLQPSPQTAPSTGDPVFKTH